jgi:hypothetical protein
MHVAQVNVARALAPLDSPRLAEFMAALEPVNTLADAAPGFVWRLQTEDGDATAVHIDDDPLVIVNLSVWRSLDALWDFVYGSPHVSVMRRRRLWFERPAESHLAIWWIPAGEMPAVADAVARLGMLRRDGPGPLAFDFKHPYAADGSPIGAWRHRALTPQFRA